MNSLVTIQLDELEILKLRSLPDVDAAYVLDARLRALEVAYRRSFVERGLILVEMEERGLWRLISDESGIPYASFDRWVCGAASHSRSECFLAMRAVRNLHDIPREQLIDIPRCNIQTLQLMSSELRKRPEILEAAKTQTEKAFLDGLPENQHIEGRQRLTINPVKSQRSVIDRAVEMAMVLEGCQNREEAFEVICQNYFEVYLVDYENKMRERA